MVRRAANDMESPAPSKRSNGIRLVESNTSAGRCRALDWTSAFPALPWLAQSDVSDASPASPRTHSARPERLAGVNVSGA